MTQPATDDVFTANNDTADQIVDAVVPDQMPQLVVTGTPGPGPQPADIKAQLVAMDEAEDDEIAVVDDIDYDAQDSHGRPLYDEDQDEQWYFGDKDWPHQYVTFRGDLLAVRKPQKKALSAFSLSASKHVKPITQNNLTGLFIERHLSEATYDRVFMRMMDPDDEGYNTKSIGELIGKVVKLTTEPKVAELDELDNDSAGDASE